MGSVIIKQVYLLLVIPLALALNSPVFFSTIKLTGNHTSVNILCTELPLTNSMTTFWKMRAP